MPDPARAAGAVLREPRVRRSRRRTGRSRRSPPSSTLPSVTSQGGGIVGRRRAMVKWQGGHFYVFGGRREQRPPRAGSPCPCVGDATARVLGENRTIPVPTGIVRRLLRRRQRRPHLPHRRRLGLRSAGLALQRLQLRQTEAKPEQGLGQAGGQGAARGRAAAEEDQAGAHCVEVRHRGRQGVAQDPASRQGPAQARARPDRQGSRAAQARAESQGRRRSVYTPAGGEPRTRFKDVRLKRRQRAG